MIRNVEAREGKAVARQWYVKHCDVNAAYVRALARRIDSGATDRSTEEQTLRVELRSLESSGAGHVRVLLGILDNDGIRD
jgi:hypothetical protein